MTRMASVFAVRALHEAHVRAFTRALELRLILSCQLYSAWLSEVTLCTETAGARAFACGRRGAAAAAAGARPGAGHPAAAALGGVRVGAAAAGGGGAPGRAPRLALARAGAVSQLVMRARSSWGRGTIWGASGSYMGQDRIACRNCRRWRCCAPRQPPHLARPRCRRPLRSV